MNAAIRFRHLRHAADRTHHRLRPAVLERACARAGLPVDAAAHPRYRIGGAGRRAALGGYTLQHLAGWLGVTVEGARFALGDAILTRTFPRADPEAARRQDRQNCGSRTGLPCADDVLDEQHTPVRRKRLWRHSARGKLRGIDAFPYRHRVARRDERTGARRRGGRFARRSAQTHGRRENFFGPGGRQGRRRAAARCRYRHRHRTRCAACARRAWRRRASPHGRHHRQQTLAAVPADAFVYRAIGRMAGSISSSGGRKTIVARSAASSPHATCCACARRKRWCWATASIEPTTCRAWPRPGRGCRKQPLGCWLRASAATISPR